jgi:hypothetical protein
MKKLTYITILTMFYGCSLFGQPDTLEYYSKSWGDSMMVENKNLRDSIVRIDSNFNAMISVILDMKLNVDTAYWENSFADFTFRARSENGLAEAEITLADSTYMRLLYVDDSMNCMVRNKDGWIKGQLNFNFDR